jgi:hypothetical protein
MGESDGTWPCNDALFLMVIDLKQKGLALAADCFVSDQQPIKIMHD